MKETDKQEQLENLGMFWEGECNFKIPLAESTKFAIAVLEKNMANITWNYLSIFENNPTTFPQTITILNGQSVAGIKIEELLQVKHYGEANKELVRKLKDETFKLDIETASALHNLAAKDEALTWGELRSGIVSMAHVDYAPPAAEELPKLADKGFNYLNKKIESVPEKAFACFLFVARNQLFYDVNKRTASLMANGILVSNKYYPITILNDNSEQFNKNLTDFYNTGNATTMMKFFEQTTKDLYKIPAQDKQQTKVKTPKTKNPDYGR